MSILRRKGSHPDYILLASVFLLTAGGLIMLASASSELGSIKLGDSNYYVRHQIVNGLMAGIAGFLAGFFIYYGAYRRVALILLIVNLALLLLVFSGFGITAGGASRWIALGPVSFQPAELLKLSFMMYVAAWLAGRHAYRTESVRGGLVPFLVISGITAGLLIAQPATSTVVILLGAAVVTYFMSGARIRYIAAILVIGVVSFGILVYMTPYRLERVMSFLSPDQDAQDSGYHSNQALIAIGSGGMTGVGYGRATAKQGYLPAVVDDSIFAVIAQELGFVGAGTVVVLFAILSLRMFWIAKNIHDRFGKLLLVGFGAVIACQSIVNIGAMSGLLPLTGVPLPFISYGGTALAVFLTMSGIAINVSKFA